MHVIVVRHIHVVVIYFELYIYICSSLTTSNEQVQSCTISGGRPKYKRYHCDKSQMVRVVPLSGSGTVHVCLLKIGTEKFWRRLR